MAEKIGESQERGYAGRIYDSIKSVGSSTFEKTSRFAKFVGETKIDGYEAMAVKGVGIGLKGLWAVAKPTLLYGTVLGAKLIEECFLAVEFAARAAQGFLDNQDNPRKWFSEAVKVYEKKPQKKGDKKE